MTKLLRRVCDASWRLAAFARVRPEINAAAYYLYQTSDIPIKKQPPEGVLKNFEIKDGLSKFSLNILNYLKSSSDTKRGVSD